MPCSQRAYFPNFELNPVWNKHISIGELHILPPQFDEQPFQTDNGKRLQKTISTNQDNCNYERPSGFYHHSDFQVGFEQQSDQLLHFVGKLVQVQLGKWRRVNLSQANSEVCPKRRIQNIHRIRQVESKIWKFGRTIHGITCYSEDK
jgi:hypothetical protein